ncbi:MAG TPA: phytoene/squalene synthase family protein [Bryobacteraceae bacterium]|nr:phytoene/squalene synthase family protein [Bryobacteraceae bacterium]
MSALAESYRYCRQVARNRARNFYYSFVLLSPAQRDAMCAVYAFMRYCDDLSDEPGANASAIERWRAALGEALEGRYDGNPCWPAFHDTVRRYGIPRQYFDEMIDGVSGDLAPRRFETFEELYRYCYQVASVVGLTIIHIFGFDSAEALPLAEKCGVAFQLTNILRDIREDAGNGRIYLPLEDLRRFSVTEEQLAAGEGGNGLLRLMSFEAARARSYYDKATPLIDMVHRRSRPSLRALIGIYSRLLERIERKNYDVFSERVSLSPLEKSWVVLRAIIR